MNKVPKIQNSSFLTKKLMFTIIFSGKWWIIIEFLPPKEKFNYAYICSTILQKIDDSYQSSRPKSGSNGVDLHLDNYSFHSSNQTLWENQKLGFETIELSSIFNRLSQIGLLAIRVSQGIDQRMFIWDRKWAQSGNYSNDVINQKRSYSRGFP
jgi:hypothetical protein